MTTVTQSEKRWIVIVEWNGQKPPNQWYRTLVRLAGLDIRLDPVRTGVSTASALAEFGVVVQEGAILCASYSLARTIAGYAKTGIVVDHKNGSSEVVKPQTVMLAEALVEDFVMTNADSETLGRMRSVFGKRGNRGAAVDYAVTCFEEMITHYHSASSVVNCPHCLATQVRWRLGDPNRFADPGGDLLMAWMRTRFATGRWEPPMDGDALPPEQINFSVSSEQEFASNLLNAPILEQISGLDRAEAMRVLDAAFVARLYWNDERRMKIRLEGITKLWQSQGIPNVEGVNLAEQSQPDLFDAGLIGADRLAGLFDRWQRSKLAQAEATPLPAPALVPVTKPASAPPSASATKIVASAPMGGFKNWVPAVASTAGVLATL